MSIPYRGSPLIRRVARGTDYAVKPSPPPPDGRISPAIRELLSTPTWSVRSLLPSTEPSPSSSGHSPTQSASEITSSKLHHLLRLSALPPPSSPAEEAKLLKSLFTHIHFVRAIQAVETTDVEPLINIRDETSEGIAEQTVTLADLKPYLEKEEKVGQNGTVRRRGRVDLTDAQNRRKELRDWWIDVWRLGAGTDSRRKGNYLYVKREKKKKSEDVQTIENASTNAENKLQTPMIDNKG